MKKYARDNRPYVKPVTRIELSEKNMKLRTILIVVLLSIGVTALLVGLIQGLNVEPGWQQVEVSSKKPHCGGDFVLMYDFSDYGGSATAANKQLSALYTEAVEQAWLIFSADTEDAAVGNLYRLNRHVNEPVTLEPVLYEALAKIAAHGNRNIFLAPVYEEYNRIFLCENEAEAALYDPAFQEELQPYLQELAAFAADPQAVDVTLLGENRVQLTVSEAYMAFAQENALDTFVDFSWLKNAFIADYLAQTLADGGFTSGYLSSYDGFTRNLDSRGNSYSVNLFCRRGSDVNLPARMSYTGPMSIVFLRNYPMTELDRWHYFAYSNGQITSIHIDPADGRCRSAIDTLTGYAADKSCADILLELIPVFVAENFRPEALSEAAEQGIFTVWCEENKLRTTDPNLQLEWLDENYTFK